MDKEKKKRNIVSNIFTIIIIIIAIIIYRKYDFNFFTKGIQETGRTAFSRDSKIKYSEDKSYKIENKIENDAMFYREISVKPNTPYKVTCMIKTDNVIGKDNNPLAGAQICLNRSEEHSEVITGTQDWTEIQFLFNSKCNDKVEIGFRLGGNMAEASGIAWFSNLSIEEGVSDSDNTWKFGCFILNNADVVVEGKNVKLEMSDYEKSIISRNMERYKNSIKQMSNNQINIEYEIIEINEPLTTLSYDEENGYYISEKDVYNLINPYVQPKEYDHIYVCTNLPLESELTNNENICEWIGLGSMMYIGKGFSNIRVTSKEYQYSIQNTFPEEVFLHEFLHTLERNSKEYGYTVPALHDYEKYNYKEDRYDGLRKWYIAYMNGTIDNNGEYIGLPSEIYTLKPVKQSNFEYSHKLDKLDEPSNILETLESIIEKIKNVFKRKEAEYDYQGIVN